jgi:hypothetical protein
VTIPEKEEKTMLSKTFAMLVLAAVFFVSSPIPDDPQRCNGWYDYAAGACDSVGD